MFVVWQIQISFENQHVRECSYLEK